MDLQWNRRRGGGSRSIWFFEKTLNVCVDDAGRGLGLVPRVEFVLLLLRHLEILHIVTALMRTPENLGCKWLQTSRAVICSVGVVLTPPGIEDSVQIGDGHIMIRVEEE